MAAGEPVSVRLPSGTIAKLRALTDRPAGEIIRGLVASYIATAELEAKRGAGNADRT